MKQPLREWRTMSLLDLDKLRSEHHPHVGSMLDQVLEVVWNVIQNKGSSLNTAIEANLQVDFNRAASHYRRDICHLEDIWIFR